MGPAFDSRLTHSFCRGRPLAGNHISATRGGDALSQKPTKAAPETRQTEAGTSPECPFHSALLAGGRGRVSDMEAPLFLRPSLVGKDGEDVTL